MNRRRKSLRWGILLLFIPATLAGCVSHAEQPPNGRTSLTVSAAISLKGPLDAVAGNYETRHPGTKISCNYGSSGTLQHQIEQGAPVDVFVSAAEKQMDQLQKENLLREGTRRDIVSNQLVLIVPAGEKAVHRFEDLRNPRVRTIAVGEPETVPAGIYAQQVLEYLKLLPAIQKKLVDGDNVRQVLAYVETGNADAGLVYASDAQITHQVRVVAVAPVDSHDPILYPAAVLKNSKSPAAARSFLRFLSTGESLAVFEKFGFEAAPRLRTAR